MLVLARYLLDRLVHERTRAVEVRDVRRRLAKQAKREAAGEDEEQIALELKGLRERLCDRFGRVECCGRCVRPGSRGWHGGDCCSGQTDRVFTDDELAALRLSGTTPGNLGPPRSAHRGCAFRGPEGCSLEPAHRPCICISYTCRDLGRELLGHTDRREISTTSNARLMQRAISLSCC